MLRNAALSVTVTALVLFTACSDDGREASASVSQPTGVSTAPATDATASTTDAAPTSSGTATSEPATTTSASATATASSGDPVDPKFDIGGKDLGASTTGETDGCKKVDFLFVIDNSASMEDNQAALIASFPGFIDAIKTTLSEVTDYHIMVVDSDADGRCEQPCVVDADYQEFCSPKNFHACNANLTECDTTRGAGVLHPVGLHSSNKKCQVFGGNRYMLPEDPDLLATFACVAQVGTAGHPSERPMNGMQEAVSEALNAPDGCNAGFLRDDAILVITVLTDDPNYEDMGTPAEWKASVVAAKNGDESAVVIAGLIPKPDLGCTNNGNTMGAHWQEFIDSWGDHGISGSICEPDYAPFFEQAVAIIDETCDNFNPPG
ncbi:hypothetical protein [Nannocystis radixulma]|uniref:VWFA domain-containing protein n=1 Tax=Nannocystis radixulma TaxID=2995305 RepID=A0ABT5BPQ9_9BACT|nr:hypothetical protein [Nannocystis radixulma]MDC0675539.1 hypothetical protein [Nannocystis radixulma]